MICVVKKKTLTPAAQDEVTRHDRLVGTALGRSVNGVEITASPKPKGMVSGI